MIVLLLLASRYLTCNANTCARMLSSTSTNNEFSNLKRKSLSHGRLKRITSRGKFGRFDPPYCYQKPFFRLVTVQNQESVDSGYPSSAQKNSTDEVSVFQYPKNKLTESLIPAFCQPRVCATMLFSTSTNSQTSTLKRKHLCYNVMFVIY